MQMRCINIIYIFFCTISRSSQISNNISSLDNTPLFQSFTVGLSLIHIYVKFRLFYSESSGGGLVSATDIINHYTNFFDFSGTCQVDNVSWAYSFESVDDMSDVNLYPGGSSVCSKAILVNRGNTPITYCVQTGYNESTYSPIYTWFSTGK